MSILQTIGLSEELTNRSMKSDKRSKMFLLLTIAPSVCMVFSAYPKSELRKIKALKQLS